MASVRWLVTLLVAAGALVLAALALALPLTQWGVAAMGPGQGMMSPGAPGSMMGGDGAAVTTGPPSQKALGAVRTQVESWLDSHGFAGFRVSEVMAFSNNDYVAVEDAEGTPAFELLVWPGRSWLMEEPPSMMWNTRYGRMWGRNGMSMGGMMGGSMMGPGMMRGGWYRLFGKGQGPVRSVREAATVADRWLARARPGERVESAAGGMGAFPGYYTLDTERDGKVVGMVSVNASSGAVWYHAWHGRFLGERDF